MRTLTVFCLLTSSTQIHFRLSSQSAFEFFRSWFVESPILIRIFTSLLLLHKLESIACVHSYASLHFGRTWE
ncbi:hypothetical protein GE061_016955, partial [Apolygus lucorum]